MVLTRNTVRTRAVHGVRNAKSACRALVCFTALLVTAAASGQDGRVVLSVDNLRTDLIDDVTEHQVLPVAVFSDGQFQKVSEWSKPAGARTMRRDLLVAYPSVQVVFRGRRIGTLAVSGISQEVFHCVGLPVGSGDFEADVPLPESEVSDSGWGWLAGETIEYRSQSFLALSGEVEAIAPDGDPLVVAVTDPTEIERFAMDVATVAPRLDQPQPLSEDDTRAYRLERYGAVLVVRKRRSAEMLPFPVEGVELLSPLMTDIVVVRIRPDERIVHPVWISSSGTDSWGKGPQDYFIDAFEPGDGSAYLAFHRRNYEANLLRLYRLPEVGQPELVFEDDLYGC